MKDKKTLFYFFKGRVALYAILKTFNLLKDDIVLIPGYTCFVVPLAVKYTGARVEYVDINPESYNAHYENYLDTYERLKGNADKIKALIIQHTYGNPNKDSRKIIEWAKSKNILVIEDCAHIFIINNDEDTPGQMGDAAFYSTQWSKPLITGIGGIARLNNLQYLEAMKFIYNQAVYPSWIESIKILIEVIGYSLIVWPRIYWFAKSALKYLSQIGIFISSSSQEEFKGELPGRYLKKMGFIQKFFFTLQFRKIYQYNQNRLKLMQLYNQLLTEHKIPLYKYEKNAVLLRYPLLVENRNTCLKESQHKYLEIGDWFNQPLHPYECNLKALDWQDGRCPQAEYIAQHIINLPIHQRIRKKNVIELVQFITKFCKILK